MNSSLEEIVRGAEQTLAADPLNPNLREAVKNLFLDISSQLELLGQQTGTMEPLELSARHRKRALELTANLNSLEAANLAYAVALLFHRIGKQNDCNYMIKQMLDIRERIAETHPLYQFPVRFFGQRSPILTNIGHLLNDPDSFIKEGLLGWRRPYHGILLAPNREVVSPALLDYWRKYLCIVTDGSLAQRLQPAAEVVEFDTFWRPLPGGSGPVYMWSRYIAIQKQWEERNLPPLLKLLPSHEKDGMENLRRMGINPGCWFVTLHVRDQSRGKLGQVVDSKTTSNRDADIDSYASAIEAIVQRGGKVIRLGDPSMKPAPKIDGLIDYVHSPFRCDWMDLFLISKSTFFLGTSSGPNGIPIVFGIPSLLTNMSSANGFALSRRDMYMPKLMWSTNEQRLLSFGEMMAPPFDWCFNMAVYESRNVELVPNSAEEIRDATIEMLDRLDSRFVETDLDRDLQNSFRAIAAVGEPHGINCIISTTFLRKYRALLGHTDSALKSPPVSFQDTRREYASI